MSAGSGTPPIRAKSGIHGRFRSRGRRRGLLFLALFLGLSGTLRLALGLDLALAETSVSGEASHSPVVFEPETCEPDAGAQAMLQSLQDREARLAEQERKAAEREALLNKARTEIDLKLAQLADAEQKLAATVAIADQASERDLGTLVAMYESMKPKDAARLFGEMTPEFAAGFLSRMRPEAAAAVLAGLDPGKAYAISAVLAGRNAKAPKS